MAMILQAVFVNPLTAANTWYELDNPAAAGGWAGGKLDVEVSVVDVATKKIAQEFWYCYSAVDPNTTPPTAIFHRGAGTTLVFNNVANIGYVGPQGKNNPFRLWVQVAAIGSQAQTVIAGESL